jgi:hypothetical protein
MVCYPMNPTRVRHTGEACLIHGVGRMELISESGFPRRGEGGRRDWIDARAYTAVQRFFLGRLERFVGMKDGPGVGLEAWQKALVHRSIYSTYCDCVEHGLADEARLLLRREQESPPTPASK